MTEQYGLCSFVLDSCTHFLFPFQSSAAESVPVGGVTTEESTDVPDKVLTVSPWLYTSSCEMNLNLFNIKYLCSYTVLVHDNGVRLFSNTLFLPESYFEHYI